MTDKYGNEIELGSIIAFNNGHRMSVALLIGTYTREETRTKHTLNPDWVQPEYGEKDYWVKYNKQYIHTRETIIVRYLVTLTQRSRYCYLKCISASADLVLCASNQTLKDAFLLDYLRSKKKKSDLRYKISKKWGVNDLEFLT